jgi:hypothetical protein
MDGEFLFEIDGRRQPMTAGTSILVPRGLPHRFKNTGTATGKFIALCQPASLLEESLAALSRMTDGDRRDTAKMRAALAQYDIDVIGPPLP